MKIPYSLALIFPLALLVFSVTAAKPDPVEAVHFDPVVRDIEGWKVHVDPALLEGEHAERGGEALKMLANHLQRIAILVPEEALEKLKQCEIWIEWHHPTLGAMQYDARVQGERPPVPGGLGSEGITNVVSDGRQSSSTTESLPEWPERLVEGSTLTTDGYPITYGSSFLMAVELTPDGPDGHTILTYGQVGDPELPGFTRGVQAFADGQWKPALFTREAIEADSSATVTEVSA